jgi:hypothetical protein
MLTSRRLHGLVLSLAAASFGLLTWLYFSTPEAISAQVCPINRVTGVPCPSCGTARALILLVDGHLAAALLTNPLGYLAAVALVIFPVWSLADIVRKRDTLYLAFRKTESILRQNRWLAGLLIILILANWIWNVLKGL